jgi:hypothetical protein
VHKIDWDDQDIEWYGQSWVPLELDPASHADQRLRGRERGLPVWSEGRFQAGRLSRFQHIDFWEQVILPDHPRKEFILENLRGMRPSRGFRHFKGSFMGVAYDCDKPPARIFANHFPPGVTSTGESAAAWAQRKVTEDVATGAVRCLGKVGEVAPPHVVLPLTVELEKPRLITNARFVNLWGDPNPFTLNSVGQVPETFRSDGMLGSYDHKSGYHAYMFAEEEQCYFGFQIGGYYYVFAAGCFGWNCMPEIYHVAHMALLDFAQRWFHIPSLGYLDDALTGSLWNTATGAQAVSSSAEYGIDVLIWLNFLAGYTTSVRKSTLEPCLEITWLGVLIDSRQNKFFIPPPKKTKLLALMEGIVATGSISIKELESIAGKCMSLHLAVGEAAKVFTRAFFDVLREVRSGRVGSSRKILSLRGRPMQPLRRAMGMWIKFIHQFEGAPWMKTFHSTLRIQTDASGRRWGGVMKGPTGATTLEVGEEFRLSELHLDIETKEAIAVVRVLQGIIEMHGEAFLSGLRLNLWIDNRALVFAMAKGASRNVTVHAQLELLFWMKMTYNFSISPIWWDTDDNWEADDITRVERDDDWRLRRSTFLEVWATAGPFLMDLMASSVSRQHCPEDNALPFYSRFFSPGCKGVDVLAQHILPGAYYCFPHHRMVKAVVNHLAGFHDVRVVLIAQLGNTAWLSRVRGAVERHFALPAEAVTHADLSPVPRGLRFECWVLYFV